MGLDGDASSRLKRDWLFEEPEERILDEGRHYQLVGLPPEKLALCANWEDPYLPGVTYEMTDLRPGEHRGGVDLELRARAVLRVRLHDTEGNALAGEHLCVCQPAEDDPGADDGYYDMAFNTDDEGLLECAVYADVELEILQLRPDGRDRVLRQMTPHGLEEVDLVADRSAHTRLELRVLDPVGLPVPQFESTVRCLATRKDHHRFEFSSSVRGVDGVARHDVVGTAPFEIEIFGARKKEGHSLLWSGRVMTIDSAPVDGVITIELLERGAFCGRIVDVEGTALPWVRVFLRTREAFAGTSGAEEQTEVVVDPDGRFDIRLDGALQGALQEVVVDAPIGYVPVAPFLPVPREGERLIVLRRGEEISGRVVPAEALQCVTGSGALSVDVWWDEEGTRGIGSLEAPIEGNGSWRALGVPAATDLWVGLPPDEVRKAGYIPPRVISGVRAGAQDLEFRLVPGETISGRCQYDTGVPPPKIDLVAVLDRLRVADEAFLPNAPVSRQDGSFSLMGLEPGDYRLLIIDKESGVILARRDVVTGSDEAVLVHVPAVGTIRVTLEGTEDPEFCTVEVWDAGRTFRRGVWHGFPHGSSDLTVPAGYAYYVVATHPAGLAGSAGPLSVGGEATIKLVEAVRLSGRLCRSDGNEGPFLGCLYGRKGGACFDLDLGEDGYFGLERGVEPGVYEIWYEDQSGAARLVERDVTAGAEDLEFIVE